MCLSAFVFAKIKKLVYGVSLAEVSATRIDVDLKFFLSKASQPIEVVHNFMEAECGELYTHQN